MQDKEKGREERKKKNVTYLSNCSFSKKDKFNTATWLSTRRSGFRHLEYIYIKQDNKTLRVDLRKKCKQLV